MNFKQELTTAVKKAGLRLTPQRMAIYHLLTGSKQHPSAQMIYHDLLPEYPSLSLTTVYNTLETLVGLGLINELGAVGSDGVRYDADTGPHVNLACTNCHKVIDLPSKYVSLLDEEVAQTSGYQILGSRALYYGICPDCHEIL